MSAAASAVGVFGVDSAALFGMFCGVYSPATSGRGFATSPSGGASQGDLPVANVAAARSRQAMANPTFSPGLASMGARAPGTVRRVRGPGID